MVWWRSIPPPPACVRKKPGFLLQMLLQVPAHTRHFGVGGQLIISAPTAPSWNAATRFLFVYLWLWEPLTSRDYHGWWMAIDDEKCFLAVFAAMLMKLSWSLSGKQGASLCTGRLDWIIRSFKLPLAEGCFWRPPPPFFFCSPMLGPGIQMPQRPDRLARCLLLKSGLTHRLL